LLKVACREHLSRRVFALRNDLEELASEAICFLQCEHGFAAHDETQRSGEPIKPRLHEPFALVPAQEVF